MNALPSPKPNRRKRLALRFAVLVLAVSVLGAAYWFTRPPELVWWTSAEIGKTCCHVRALVPNDWKSNAPTGGFTSRGDYRFFFGPANRMPRWLRRIFRHDDEEARLTVYVGENDSLYRSHLRLTSGAIEVVQNRSRQQNQALRWIKSPDTKYTSLILLS